MLNSDSRADDILVLSPSRRTICCCADKLHRFRADPSNGYLYIEYQPQSPQDRLVPEDLAVTLVFNSRATGMAFSSLVQNAASIDLSILPNKELHMTMAEEREIVADVISKVASWPGFGTSLATKVLHKKRPGLIPVLDNGAILEAYLDPRWPERRTMGESVRSHDRVLRALECTVSDLIDTGNTATWEALHKANAALTRTEILDMVWWMHFREIEPV